MIELSGTDLDVQTEQFLGEELSTPSARADDRDAGRDLCQAVARALVFEIRSARKSGLACGTVHFHRTAQGLRANLEDFDSLYDDVVSSVDEPWLGSFAFALSSSATAVIGGGATVGRILDSEAHGGAFLRKIELKARKQCLLPLEHQRTPFVVPVQNEETDLQPVTVLSCLTGSRGWLRAPRVEPARPPPRIAAAVAEGWAYTRAAGKGDNGYRCDRRSRVHAPGGLEQERRVPRLARQGGPRCSAEYGELGRERRHGLVEEDGGACRRARRCELRPLPVPVHRGRCLHPNGVLPPDR
jgi:hypothetical protein